MGKDPNSGFPGGALTKELIDGVKISSQSAARDHEEILEILQADGHNELTGAVSSLLRRWNKYNRWKEGRTLGGRIRKLAKDFRA